MAKDLLDDIFTEKEVKSRAKAWVYFIWILLIATGTLFRVMHWPGGLIILTISTAGFSGMLFHELIILENRKFFTLLFGISMLLWILYILYGYFFQGGYPLNKNGLYLFALVFVASSFTYYGIYKKRKNH